MNESDAFPEELTVTHPAWSLQVRLLGVSLAWVTFGLTAAEAQEKPTLPASAQRAAKEYQRDLADAESKLAAAVDDARERFVAKLTELMKKETSAGNLDKAVALRDEIKRVQGEKVPERKAAAKGPQLASYAGRWSIWGSAPAENQKTYLIDRTGKVKELEHALEGQLVLAGGFAYLEIPSRSGGTDFEHLTLVGNRLLIEHWYPKDNYEKKVATNLALGINTDAAK
jgi:hypothetical protein